MKIRIAVGVIVASTGVFVFSLSNNNFSRRNRLIQASSSFLMGMISTLYVVAKSDKYEEKIAEIELEKNQKVLALNQQNEEIVLLYSKKIEEVSKTVAEEKDTVITALEEEASKLEKLVKSCDIRIEEANTELACRYEKEITVIQEQLEAKLSSQISTSEAISDELRTQLEIARQKLENFYNRENFLAAKEQQLNNFQQKLEFDSRELQIRNKESALDIDKALLAEQAKFDEIVSTNEFYKTQLAKYEEILNVLQVENNSLKNNSKLRAAHGGSYEAFLSHIIQYCFLENEIPVQYAEVDKIGDSLAFKFFLADSTKASKAQKINDSLTLAVGSHCETLLKGGYLIVRVYSSSSRSIEPAYIPSTTPVVTPQYWNIEASLDHVFHFFVVGPTGAGKSVFVDNLVNLAHIALEGEVELFVVDPKPLNDWSFGGVEFTPQYQGVNLKHPTNSIEGLRAVQKSMDYRLEIATEAKNNKEPMPEFTPQIWVIDELPLLKSIDSKATKEFINTIPSVGRALKIIVIVVSQQTNLVPNHLSAGTAQNFARCYLGGAAKVGSVLNREVNSPIERKEVKQEIANLVREGHEYFSLVCPGATGHYVVPLPPPGYYKEKHNKLSGEASPTKVEVIRSELRQEELQCPHCSSNKVSKNGTDRKTKQQKYKCRECGKQFRKNIAELVVANG